MKAWSSERRVKRSSDPEQALHLLLQAVCEKHRLKSVALADASGVLVAGAGPECDELAAWAPLLDRVAEEQHVAEQREAEGRSVRPGMSVARVPGMAAYVCALGLEGEPEHLEDAALGCSRILVSRAA